MQNPEWKTLTASRAWTYFAPQKERKLSSPSIRTFSMALGGLAIQSLAQDFEV